MCVCVCERLAIGLEDFSGWRNFARSHPICVLISILFIYFISTSNKTKCRLVLMSDSLGNLTLAPTWLLSFLSFKLLISLLLLLLLIQIQSRRKLPASQLQATKLYQFFSADSRQPAYLRGCVWLAEAQLHFLLLLPICVLDMPQWSSLQPSRVVSSHFKSLIIQLGQHSHKAPSSKYLSLASCYHSSLMKLTRVKNSFSASNFLQM